MVRSHRHQLIIGLSAAALVAMFAPTLPARTLEHSHASSTASTGVLAEGDSVTLQWVFRAGDLLSCRTSARDLRHASLAYGSRVKIHAVAVATDVELVRGFLRSERLTAEVVPVSEREYRQHLGSVPTPSVAIVQNGRMLELFGAGNLHIPGRQGTDQLDQTLARLFEGSTSILPSVSPRSPNR